jgi:hypothetical protein
MEWVWDMRSAEEYRGRAIEFLEAAQTAEPSQRPGLVDLALSYLRLAELAVKNSRTDLVYETPAPRPAVSS